MSLQRGQIVRYASDLWRVDYVNFSRARLVPLAKRHVVLADGREFDAERTGINISPDSPLEVVTDIEKARLELELAEAEADLARLRAEQEREQTVVVAPPSVVAAAAPRKQAVWYLDRGAAPEVEAGSVKDEVLQFLRQHPGATTKQIADASHGSAGAVAACLDRFWKAGVLIKD